MEVEQDQKTAVVQHKMDQEIQVVLEVEREDLLFLQVAVEFLDKVLMVEIMVVQVRLTEVVLVVVELVRQELMVMMLVAQ